MTARYEDVLMRTFAPAAPIFVRGEGSVLFDDQGRRYIDLAGGLAVNALGHANPAWADALCRQAGTLAHVCNLFRTDLMPAAGARLLELAGMERIFFANSGAEANECALKCARKRGAGISADKFRVVSFEGSFHGRIGLSLAASGQPKLRAGHGPQAPGFAHVALHDEAALRAACDERLCAIIAEPILGEGGVRVVERGFLELARELCDRNDALLIMDEVQTGCGRTGAMFRHQELGLQPDLLVLAKGLGGGFPVGAALAGARAAEVFAPGDHGTTFGGNPLAMAAVGAVLDALASPGFLEGVRSKGARIAARLDALAGTAGWPVDEVRGCGLMIGLRIDPDRMSAADAAAGCVAAGVLVAPAADNIIRLLPALNAPDEAIDEGLDRLEQALRS